MRIEKRYPCEACERLKNTKPGKICPECRMLIKTLREKDRLIQLPMGPMERVDTNKLFQGVLLDAENEYNYHRKTKKDSWRNLSIDFLRWKLYDEWNDYQNCKSTDYENIYTELIDILLMTFMLATRIAEKHLVKNKLGPSKKGVNPEEVKAVLNEVRREDKIETILAVIIGGSRPLTTRQISKITGYSWQATKKYLVELFDKGYIEKGELKNRTYWKHRKIDKNGEMAD